MKQIITEQFIEASPEKVWNILTDTAAYPKWNPFIVRMEGEIKPNAVLINTMMNGEKSMTFKPTIIAYEKGVYFEWLGKMPLGMFNGRHFFRLSPLQGGTLLSHGEYFSGWLHRLILGKIGEQTRQNFIAMNHALQQRAEKA